MNDSEFIKIEPNKGTLTLQLAGQDPLIVVKANDEVRAGEYAKILRSELLDKIVAEMRAQSAGRPSDFGGTERKNLTSILKVFERELSTRTSG